MKLKMLACLPLVFVASAFADDLTKSDKLLCAAAEITVCFELDECYPVVAEEIDMPTFVVVDLKTKQLLTTKASRENRSTAVATVARENGRIYLQGIERGRAYSFVINEETGHLTVAVSRDGLSVSVFGACTDADI